MSPKLRGGCVAPHRTQVYIFNVLWRNPALANIWTNRSLGSLKARTWAPMV